jgi:hypothetical protein
VIGKNGLTLPTNSIIYNEIVSGTKIKDLDNQLFEIAKLLENIYNYTGLIPEKKPNEEMKVMLFRHIINTCGNLTINEVLKAFQMGVTGEIDVDMNHYQNFSPLYFSTVVNAYTEYRRKIVAQINKERVERESLRTEPTEQERIETNNRFLFNFIYTPYKEYCKRGVLDFISVPISHIYLTLEDLKIIQVSNKYKKELHADVTLRIGAILKKRVSENPTTKNEIEFKNKVAKVLNGEFQKYRDAEIIEECRRIMILKTFEDYRVGKKNLLADLNIEKWAIDSGFVSK